MRCLSSHSSAPSLGLGSDQATGSVHTRSGLVHPPASFPLPPDSVCVCVQHACAQVLYTMALHYTTFGSTTSEDLHMGSRSPEEVARWRTALSRARDRADSMKGSKSAGAVPGDDTGTTGSTTGTASKGVHAAPSRAIAIGHVPTVLRDVQEIACQDPPLIGRVSQPLVGTPSASSLDGDASTGAAATTTAASAASAQPQPPQQSQGSMDDHPSPRDEGPSVAMPDDAPKWRLVGLTNGLRIFEGTSGTSGWAGSPVAKASCKVQAPSELVFRLVMDLSPHCRSQWDCHYSSGSVLQQLDGHTDICHVTFRPLHWLFRPRDVTFTRYWRREEDGTYMVLFRSVDDRNVPPQTRGVVRAELACGCIVVTPLGDNCCLLTHVLEARPNGWAFPSTGLPRMYQYSLLVDHVAGIRDFLEQLSAANAVSVEGELLDPLGVLLRTSDLTDEEDNSGAEPDEDDDRGRRSVDRSSQPGPAALPPRAPSTATAMDAAATPAAGEGAAAATPATPVRVSSEAPAVSRNSSPGSSSGGPSAIKRSPSIRRTVSIAGPGPTRSVTAYEPFPDDWSGLPANGTGGGSLAFGLWPAPDGSKATNVWCRPTGNRFVVRSKTYLESGIKVAAGSPLMHLVATDWLTAEQRIDNICGRPAGTCQRTLLQACDGQLRIICVNLQVPGAKPYSIIFYFAHTGPIVPGSALDKFWRGDDAYRNCRFKLIPCITEGAWAVQRSVGTKPLIVGNALRTTYYGGGDSRFLEMDVDIGSQSVANSVTRFVMVYLKTLVIDLGFVVEGKSEEELPERLFGCIRVAHLDPDLAAEAPPVA